MSAPAFTPGPWHVFASGFAAKNYNSVEINDADGLTLAWAQKFIPPYVEQAEANARLIAAAPELYEALVGLLAVPKIAGCRPCGGVDLSYGPFENVFAKAVAAIAKVLGETA